MDAKGEPELESERGRRDSGVVKRQFRMSIVGALAGGYLFQLAGSTGVTGFNLWSMFVAIIGAIVVLVIKHAIMGRGEIHT